MKNDRNNKRKFYSVNSAQVPFLYKEAFKSLRTNIKHLSESKSVSSIVITSALPGEGKSTVSVNLGLTLADDDKKVVIVDCDLRNPTIHKYLNLLNRGSGLANVLSGEKKYSDVITRIDDSSLYAVCAGRLPDNPSELLGSNEMKLFVEKLKEEFDFVILDAPPITVVTDAAIVGGLVDGAVLVARSRYTPISTLKLAKENLNRVDIPILGSVLTCYNLKNGNSGYKHSYSYASNYYGVNR